ncbi:ABC transporter ATP-binding protein [Streptomyces morookaense]|uniref:ABC transporter ATP-binding protein n=1 Tax=Streptomyces morookaense TaxID=1970 RepID=A0A7Y7B495_STRMO|nr:ABC transporter ATP-binding protein [Streptomyces morookaense]NVK78595.1 ABC transporter ATP-binding protein [Streptomyces morookaense]GHF33659.1 ABC transporter ATP-binding protein [Streptomyces morookaense]
MAARHRRSRLGGGDRLVADATRHVGARTLVLGLTSVAGTGAALLLPAVLGHTVDLLLARQSGEASRWVVLCALLLCAPAVFDALDGLLTGTTAAGATAWLRNRVLGHVLAVGPRATARFAPGDLVTRLVGNAAYVGTAPGSLASAVASVAAPLGGIAALGLVDPWLAVAFLAGAPALFLLLRAFTRASTDCLIAYQRLQGDLAGRLVEALDGVRTIAAAGTGRREADRILQPLPGLSREGHRMWRVQGRSAAQTAAVVPLLQIVVLAVAGLRLAQGALSVGDVLAASRYAVLAAGIGAIVGRLNALVHARTAAGRLAEILAEPPARYGPRELPAGDGTLRLRGVTAIRGGRTVLDGLDLVVPGGTTVAVVGRSDAGTSALAELAGRLADPDAGVVELDGVPLRDLTRTALRSHIAYAFARPALLGGTIAGTIGLGPHPPAPGTVTAAARAACADTFVRRLPERYDTPCATAPLSGGEAQRLGLARAFARPGSRLIVLDDATSSLDAVTEHRITHTLLTAAGPARTCLVVAHRTTTAARADQVAWLEDGRIRAVGTHAHLCELPGYCAAFADPEGAGPGPSLPPPRRATEADTPGGPHRRQRASRDGGEPPTAWGAEGRQEPEVSGPGPFSPPPRRATTAHAPGGPHRPHQVPRGEGAEG